MSDLDDMTGRATGAEAQVVELWNLLERIELVCLKAQRAGAIAAAFEITETILAMIEASIDA